jgi:hypothetical protein
MTPIPPAAFVGCVAALALWVAGAGAGHAPVDAMRAARAGSLVQEPAAAPTSTAGLPRAFDVGVEPLRRVRVEPGGDVRAALRAAEPGTLVLLASGQHRGGLFLEDLHGTRAAPIRLVGEEGAVLDADGAGNVLHLSRCSHVVVESLVLTGASANGLNVDDGGAGGAPSHHLVLRDLVVHGIGRGGNCDGIKLSGVDDFHVEGCVLSRIDAGDAVDMVGCHRGALLGNRVHDTPGGGFQMKGGSSDVLVHGTWFEEVAGRAVNAGGSTGLAFFRPQDATFEAARLAIESNVFVRCGAGHGCAIAFASCDDVRFVHNTVVAPRTWILRILQDQTHERFAPCRGGLVANNLFVFERASLRAAVNVGAGTAPETFTFTANLWFARDDPAASGQPVHDGLRPDTHPLASADPLFVGDDPAGARLGWDEPRMRLSDASPVAHAARPVASCGVDFAGRPRGERAAVGAFECE